ncbi:MAG: (2Fe-2S)-binding protein [Elusimicrobia bacterium]|nr:(2Fe-2S)-binding protein [Elusimicrobiota bacterium]
MPSITIDGKKISVPDGTTVIQAAEQLKSYIPRYCYHPGLSIAGNCRICLVEIEKNSKLQIACNTPVTEGMVVHTQSQKVTDGRRSVLEFLLANHPLDCPVCDQSGECDLQNFYMQFGLYDPRFQEHKVKKEKAISLGPHVMLDQERCILCSRCVRFTDEITKTGEFGIFNRGDKAEVNLYPGKVLDNPYSANVIDICPVGALTEQDFRFKARVWYLRSASTVCNGCSQGCNINLHFVPDRPHLNNGDRVVRIKPRFNPDVNEWWICDEGRYGFKPIDQKRLTKVLNKGQDSTWEQAFEAISPVLSKAGQNGHGPSVGVIFSAQLSTEELFLLREVFDGALKARLGAPAPSVGSEDDFLIKADKHPNTAGAELLGLADGPDAAKIVEEALNGKLKALWVFGVDLAAVCGAQKIQELAQKLELFVFQGPNENGTSASAHWVLPSAAYVEKDGTFINVHNRVQRIGRAFAPLKDSREDWRILLEVEKLLGRKDSASHPQEIFLEMAKTVKPLHGLDYEKIGLQGADLAAKKSKEATKAVP